MMARAPHRTTATLSDSAEGNLRYIRAAMDASGAFTSVPGVGVVGVGAIGTLTGLLAHSDSLAERWLVLWLSAAVVAAPLGAALLIRKTRRSGTSLSSGVGRRFLFALMPGFAAAALLTAGLIRADALALVPAAWLLLYGASVSAAGALSVIPVRSLGLSCMALGGLSLAFPEWGQVALLLGFGAAHLGHGIWIWRQHGG